MTATADLQRTSLTVRVEGRDVPAAWAAQLLDVRVQLGLRAIGRATVTFADAGYTLAAANLFSLGADVEIVADASTTVFEGRVHAVASEFRRGVDAVLVVTAHDAAQRVAAGSHVKVAQNVTLADVVTQLWQTAGLGQVQHDLPGETMPYQLAGDTPLGLIDEIAERTGRDWAVSGTRLGLWSATTGTAPWATDVTIGTDDGALQEFAVRRLAPGPTSFEVHGWDPVNKTLVTGKAGAPSARGTLDVPGAGNTASATVVDAHASVSTPAEAKSRAEGLAARAGRVVAQGRAQLTPNLRPGGRVSVTGVGPGSGTFYVREVTHTFDGRGTSTAFVAGDRDPVRLTDPWAAPPAASSFRHTGLVVGVVDKLADPEKLGRVSVALQSLDAQVTTTWARLLTVGGGAKRGLHVLPEVGDEVLVAFEDGDVARPVVLGGLYGKKAMPPTATVTDGAVVTRAFTSRLGHVIELSDGTGGTEQHILLRLSATQHRLRLGKDRADLEVPSGVPLKIASGDSSITFDGNGTITIEGTTITFKAKQAIEMDASTLKGKAQTQLSLEGLQVSVKGQAQVGVEASGQLQLKGAMVAIN